MGLRIALCIRSRVPVEKYGGTQRDVVWLARELTRQGHEVTLIASPGSFVPGVRMVFLQPGKPLHEHVPSGIQIVNSHAGGQFGDLPTLHTIHGNLDGPPAPGPRSFNFISANHAARYEHKTFVYNGMPVDEHYFSEAKSNRFLFFSRINRAVKNVSGAMRLAKKFNRELDLAGGARWELLTRSVVRREGAFFASFDSRFRVHGTVGGWKKAELFANARALLFPIRWEEPFGLVVVESLLAGSPVIATPRGSMPELVHPDVGFLCETDDEFGAAFEGAAAIPPKRCREYAAEHFSIVKTTRQYVELYQRILDGETLP
jgi:glycosyltransferase involved in cell wall biosynthesis